MTSITTQNPDSEMFGYIAKNLQTILSIPHSTRWVTDWLFTNLTNTPFHTQHPITPETISNSIAIHSALHVDIPPALRSYSPKSSTAKIEEDALFLPVANIGTLTVGYFFCVDTPSNDRSVKATSLTHPFTGRFVHDARENTLLKLIYGGTPPIISICWRQDRKVISAEFPSEEYAWKSLPTKPTRIVSNMHSCRSHCELSPTQSHLPWIVNKNGALSDGVPPAVNAQTTTSSSSLASSHLVQAQHELSRLLTDQYTCPGFRVDHLSPTTGEYQSCFTGNTDSISAATDTYAARILRITFSQAYYTGVLCIGRDERILQCIEHTTKTQPDEECATEEKIARILPRTYGAESVGDEEEQVTSITHNREYVLQERKKRNRLSAARSNARKILWKKEMREEIETLREQEKELLEVERAMKKENEILRRLASTEGYSAEEEMDVVSCSKTPRSSAE